MADSNVIIEDARIVLRNFTGKAGKFNKEGERSFAVLLDEPIAEKLARDGWSVKRFRAREEGDQEQAFLPVQVRFDNRPPRIVMITSNGRSTLGEDEAEVRDWVDIRMVDLIIRPYNWEVSGNTGVKAYLKSMFVTIEETELDRKYANYDELPARAGGFQ
jgi:hypothetical protein